MRHHTLCPRALLFLATFVVFLSGPVLPVRGASPQPNQASAQLDQASAQQTLDLYQSIPGLTSQQIDYGKAVIPKMHYNAQRILRKICALPGVNFEYAKQTIDILGRERFNFEQVQTFE